VRARLLPWEEKEEKKTSDVRWICFLLKVAKNLSALSTSTRGEMLSCLSERRGKKRNGPRDNGRESVEGGELEEDATFKPPGEKMSRANGARSWHIILLAAS